MNEFGNSNLVTNPPRTSLATDERKSSAPRCAPNASVTLGPKSSGAFAQLLGLPPLHPAHTNRRFTQNVFLSMHMVNRFIAIGDERLANRWSGRLFVWVQSTSFAYGDSIRLLLDAPECIRNVRRTQNLPHATLFPSSRNPDELLGRPKFKIFKCIWIVSSGIQNGSESMILLLVVPIAFYTASPAFSNVDIE